MFSVFKLTSVMSCTYSQAGFQVIIGSIDLKIIYCPEDPNDPLSEITNELSIFTDSIRATSVDTRCSHGCNVIMFALIWTLHHLHPKKGKNEM